VNIALVSDAPLRAVVQQSGNQSAKSLKYSEEFSKEKLEGTERNHCFRQFLNLPIFSLNITLQGWWLSNSSVG